MADFNVPNADGHDLEALPFVVASRQSKEVIRFSESDFHVGGSQCSGNEWFTDSYLANLSSSF
jgi:hypothetical protein